MSRAPAATFERCMAVGGVAVFPADTVYGLACDPGNRIAVERLYRLKRRRLDQPSAVMFFDRSLAFDALPELGERTRAALERLWPGPVSVLVPNPAGRFALACGAHPGTLGVRVVDVPMLRGVRWPVLQSSANLSGGPDARSLAEVPEPLRRACEMVLDGGELPGTPSTVIDLRGYEPDATWAIVRAGGLSPEDVRVALEDGERFRFEPDGYAEMIRADIPDYETLQAAVAQAAGEAVGVDGVMRVLDLGTGTGETATRVLDVHPAASLVGVDENVAMLDAAAVRLPRGRVSLRVGRLEDPLPGGPFELAVSALAVHHLDSAGKRDLFARVRAELAPGGRFVLGDLVVPDDPADAQVELTPGYDRPDSVADQLGWLAEAGFAPRVTWSAGDLAVLLAERV